VKFCLIIYVWYLEGHYDEAVSLYTKAIELNPKVPAYYGNRSFCYIKTEYYGSALEDANKAIELDKKYIKVRSPYFIPRLTFMVLLSQQVKKTEVESWEIKNCFRQASVSIAFLSISKFPQAFW